MRRGAWSHQAAERYLNYLYIRYANHFPLLTKILIMTRLIALFVLVTLLISCKKDKDDNVVVNGVEVNRAVSEMNTFRTQGIAGYPAVAALSWNDTLSNAAFNFAKAKAEDVNTPASAYTLSNGQFILNFPQLLNYSRSANFALFYGYPADAGVATVIAAGFASNDPMILGGLMNASARQMGMAQYQGRWYLILSN